MQKSRIISCLDIGSANVRAIIAEEVRAKQGDEGVRLEVLGVSSIPASGLRKGMVIDIEETVQAVTQAVEQAERNSGVEMRRVFLGIEGSHISTHLSRGTVVISRADGEVSEDDVNRAVDSAEAVSLPPNREIIKVVPQSFSIDGQENIKFPIGMNGVRLEVETLIIEGSTPAIKNLSKCLERAELEIEGLILSPMASAKAVLDKKQKELGVALVDIGAGTIGVCIYEEGNIIHIAIIPVGGGHITNDIAIGLRCSIDLAEKIKIDFGSASLNGSFKKEIIDFSKLDSGEEGSVSRYRVAEIIEARLAEIFSLVNKELKLVNRQKLLPAGVVLVGGVSKTSGILDLAKKILELPAHPGKPRRLEGAGKALEGPEFSALVGLMLSGLEERHQVGLNYVSNTTAKFKDFFRKFLP